jgi:hypothetical protein
MSLSAVEPLVGENTTEVFHTAAITVFGDSIIRTRDGSINHVSEINHSWLKLDSNDEVGKDHVQHL